MEKFTFLGCGNNALSMFCEILVSLYKTDFEIAIVKNIQLVDATPFLPSGIHANEYFYADFDYSLASAYLIGVNQPSAKKTVFDFFLALRNIDFDGYHQLVHPNSAISSTTQQGKGIVINPGVVTAPFSSIGNLVTINRNVSVGHHTIIGDFSTINPGVNIAGHCKIGSGVTIGMGANIVDGITIGNNAVIGAGSLVLKNVPANSTVYGVPAKEVS